MTRINTNVSSLVAQNTLGRSNASLNQALTRLSTGLRINTGKDDPAGLIASENLRSDITSVKKAISNTERANQVIATADSALGQVSSLLNDIRGLVTESANSGALSADQIAANQLQIDSSLEALNRIAQTTTFQGRKLLDGSLDFITTTADTDFTNLSNLKIDQANLGSTGSVSVDIAVTSAATQAQVNVTSVPVVVPGVAATTTATFTNTATQATGGTVTIGAETFSIAADAGGAADGAEGNQAATITITYGAGAAATSYTAGTNTLNVSVTQASGVATVANIQAAINAGSDFTASGGTGGNTVTGSGTIAGLAGGRDAGSAVITITAATAGTAGNAKTVTITESATPTTSAPTATVDGSGNITVLVNNAGTTTLSAINSAINALTDYNSALVTTTGDGNYNAVTQSTPTVANTAGGTNTSGGISADLVIELSGSNGGEVLSFEAGTSLAQLVSGINLVQDATGVSASSDGTTLELTSTGYGSAAIVDVKVISEGTGLTPAGTFTTALGGTSDREEGTDIVATINGVAATGDGNNLTINTATLDISTTVTAAFVGTVSFTITGGGALFQLGPDVVSNQQARLGIGSVNTARLGGTSGKLFQLGTGGSASLSGDTTNAARIIGEAIDQVTSLRGRLGAFQRTSLETNKNALNDTLTNLTDAESAIRDADFASETAALTRAQILVQSGTTVLQIANSNPQNVLALLQR
ncbi:MAG: flagellin [Bythopirellula sp.]|nr:flagellin [Bythopirellula sp.]